MGRASERRGLKLEPSLICLLLASQMLLIGANEAFAKRNQNIMLLARGNQQPSRWQVRSQAGIEPMASAASNRRQQHFMEADRPAPPATNDELPLEDASDSITEESGEPQSEPQHDLRIEEHKSRLQAMQDLFERRFLNQQQQHHQPAAHLNGQMQASQELNPIAIGLEPVGPQFGMAMNPFGGAPSPGNQHQADQKQAVEPLDPTGLGPALPFNLGALPHLIGFGQANGFDGPQRGDQSAHSNFPGGVAAASVNQPDTEQLNGGGGSGGGVGNGAQKNWPKIFRFTDGRINLSDFEKQKKIRLSSKSQHQGENHIESAPIMFDGRPLKRKSFLILHGGIYS